MHVVMMASHCTYDIDAAFGEEIDLKAAMQWRSFSTIQSHAVLHVRTECWVHSCSTSIERTQGIRPEVDEAIQQSVGRCIQETDLDIGERTVVR